MEPIRVLQCFTIMNRGGAETMIMNYYRNIDRSKVQFDFIVHREEKGAYEDEIEKLGGRIFRMPSLYPQNFIKYTQEIRRFLDKHKEYKIIHGHFSELGYFLYKEAKKQDVPVRIVHAHNYSRGFDLKSILRFYWKNAMRKHVSHMFSCSDMSSRWLFGNKNAKNAIIMNNAIEASKFSYNENRAKEIRKSLGIENSFVIGHVGRFNVQKNHEFLIDIFEEVKKKNDNSKLVLVGQGQLEERIKNKVKELKLENHVLFLGNRSDVNELMQAFDTFVFPSVFEGLGVVLIEAQAAGLKTFTSENRVPKDAKITDLLEYLPIEKGAKYWADNILQYKSGYKRRNTFQEVIDKKYDIKENVKWLEEFYLNEYNKY